MSNFFRLVCHLCKHDACVDIKNYIGKHGKEEEKTVLRFLNKHILCQHTQIGYDECNHSIFFIN